MNSLKKPNNIVWILLIINLIWLISYLITPIKVYAVKYFFLYLFLTFLLLFINHQKWNKEFILSFFLILGICFLFEFITLKSGLILGNYAYNYKYLYAKINFEGVPIFTVLFSFMLLYGTRFIAQFLSKDALLASAISAVISTLLMFLFLDFLKLNYIFISGGGITGKYWYFSYFLFYILTNYIIFKSTKPNQNKVVNYVLLIITALFVLLKFL